MAQLVGASIIRVSAEADVACYKDFVAQRRDGTFRFLVYEPPF